MLDELLARVQGLGADERAALVQAAAAATSGRVWFPNAGPQTNAVLSPADVLLYGGQAAGGKTDCLLGLAFTEHRRSLILRRQYTDLGALLERAIKINGTRDGFNGSPPPKLRTADGRLIEFGACAKLGDEAHWQGQPHDYLALDEGVHFLEAQVRFLMGWVRTEDLQQRTRTVIGTNPPVSADGDWIVGMFRPWLDITHPNPAKAGELRWFVTDPDGKDFEVPGPEMYQFPGQPRPVKPMSRTFIPAKLSDNPYLARTDYGAKLDALPEPLRSAVRDGNFMAARQDDDFQVIPSDWVIKAQQRWAPGPPRGRHMTCVAVDVARGGKDETVLAARYDGWYAPLTCRAGIDTKDGPVVAGLVFEVKRDGAPVVIDMGGGWGGSPLDHLKQNDVDVIGYVGAAASSRRTKDNKLSLVNKRAESWWRFREALDPSQREGSPIQLPNDPQLMADLTAPRWELTPRGIKVEPKEDIIARLGRSPDRGDAVVMCWHDGQQAALKRQVRHSFGDADGRGRGPQVRLGHQAAKRYGRR